MPYVRFLIVLPLLLVLFVGPEATAQESAAASELRSQYERIMRTYLDGWETGESSFFEQVLAPDFVDYMYGRLRTREQLLVEAAQPRFLKNQITIEDVFADGEIAMVRVSNRFLHPETGREATMHGMIIVRIVDGMIVEGWGVHDRLGLWQQLGVLPTGQDLFELVRDQLGME